MIGETDDSLLFIPIGLNGEYWSVYTDENGCSRSSNRIENQIIVTGMSNPENENELEVTVYPNPLNNILNVDGAEQIDELMIYGLNGQLVYQQNGFAPGFVQLDLNMLTSGQYIMNIISGEQQTARQLIKM